MNVIHQTCDRWIEIWAEFDPKTGKVTIYIDGEPRTVCPRCFQPLAMATLRPVKSFQDMTPEESGAEMEAKIIQVIYGTT